MEEGSANGGDLVRKIVKQFQTLSLQIQMGACASAPPTSPETARIDAQLRAEANAEKAKIKLLLLGTGESK